MHLRHVPTLALASSLAACSGSRGSTTDGMGCAVYRTCRDGAEPGLRAIQGGGRP